jgi:rod shape determining protein RodA
VVVAGLGLSAVGLLLVWSATRHTAGSTTLLKHLVNVGMGLGLGCFVVVTRIDHRTLRAWAPWVYLASLLGLVAVLSPLGSTVNGSRSWIQLPGGFSLQPSELVKVALCVGLAMMLAERRDRDLPLGRAT